MAHTSNSGRRAGEQDSKEPLIRQIMELFGQVQRRIEAEDDEERQWMVRNCDNAAIVGLLKDTTVTELHVLDAIGRLEPVNGITVSRQFGIPKGSVSKITRRLTAKGLIQKQFLPNNKKEVLFRTTSLGRELFRLHEALHRQIEQGVVRFLQKYDDAELRVLARILQDSVQTSWVNPQAGPGPEDEAREAEPPSV
ncbi:MarR family winged helix-turn-helix transcriptional regulator [Paenibacillus ehimensis]|uniref:MarR family transcriptional regulator n=1 Tax=Paenibacillus ehimensis TaxID=79264 RepID=A0ABT8VH99_9BACL|nr:MarR family transcriptional regulator [Paenibacillus ehimensis]MDO3680353.1 MarR family transcriptional regulator [Paenibacillus ehimensis]MEC0207558.1 MarR family transcriptional regulator [Paenibacillus ehimensis]